MNFTLLLEASNLNEIYEIALKKRGRRLLKEIQSTRVQYVNLVDVKVPQIVPYWNWTNLRSITLYQRTHKQDA